jgi:hypothetical protein
MLYSQRLFTAAAIIIVLLFSAIILPEAVSARTRKCPVDIPDSLLTLYLKSDLVVVGSLKSENFLKTTQEYDYGSYSDVEKILNIDETYKGQKLDSAAYKISEYKPKNTDASESMVNEENEHLLKFGEKALFFLVKDAESGYYELAHYGAAIKQLNATDLSLYEKRIKELKSILAKDKNQHARLAEWLVRLIEEPATREEGVRDLLASFTASDYADEIVEEVTDVKENVEEQAEEIAEAKTEQVKDKKPVEIDKNFRTASAPEIAASLTDSQKARVSNTLFGLLSNDLARLNNAENEEYVMPNYELIALVSRWDKQNFAMNLYANLQNADGANIRRESYLMRAVASFLEDENLSIISDDYEYTVSQDQNAEMDYTGSTLENLETQAGSGDVENSEAVSESEAVTEKETQNTQEAVTETQTPVLEKTAEKEVVKITYKQYRAKLFEAFNAQYGKVISQTIAAR